MLEFRIYFCHFFCRISMLKRSRRGAAPPRSHTPGQLWVLRWKWSRRRELRSLRSVMLLGRLPSGMFSTTLYRAIIYTTLVLLWQIQPILIFSLKLWVTNTDAQYLSTHFKFPWLLQWDQGAYQEDQGWEEGEKGRGGQVPEIADKGRSPEGFQGPQAGRRWQQALKGVLSYYYYY